MSYVYSAYAPLSVRLVQCVAQKGGVLASAAAASGISDPNLGHGVRGGSESGGNPSDAVDTHEDKRPFASPISGWRGFEDALKLIPGATVDVVQNPPARPNGAGQNAPSHSGEHIYISAGPGADHCLDV